MYQFHQDEQVTIHSLGSTMPDEYRGIIKGISVNDVGPAAIYIVQMCASPLSLGYPFTHATFPAACLRSGWDE
jgi:hypothetical protein